MKNLTILTYRNNQTWQALANEVLSLATKMAEEKDTQLTVKIFDPTDGSEVIDQWFDSVKAEGIPVFVIADGTVKERLQLKGFNVENYDEFEDLNDYLVIKTNDTFNHISVDELYATTFTRLAEAVKPDLWLVMTSRITDYDPLGIIGGKEDSEATAKDRQAYIEKICGFIPTNQSVKVITHGEPLLAKHVESKKVVIFAHHHAMSGSQGDVIDMAGKGSLWIDTYPSSFLRTLNGVIRTDDLIGDDVLEIMRKRLKQRM